ncbi:hypothetical protein D9758_003172 [Tetrapyrgos nigripes]|uniref:PIN domain-containing protein n=1 Tax=Tetrapyrgos nigripes TaxID=182062 RepID=A0A8H5GJB5_9AGAR|nr:hypothetical protein D9758_003172 [Tetrapyrgos nigripes]
MHVPNGQQSDPNRLKRPKHHDAQPQPTDIDQRLIALKRRSAVGTRQKEREKPERPTPPSPQVIISRPPEADPDDFSRRLNISSSPTPRAAQPSSRQNQPTKLYNPERDPIPTMRRTAEPEPMSDSPPPRNANAMSRDRNPAARQLFDPRKDDPVRFAVLARPQPGQRPMPTPKSSGEYISASSTSSYAPSQASSSFTLSSNTDGSSASSALFEHSRPSDEAPGNMFAQQLKKLYRSITNLEAKIKQEDADVLDDDSGESGRKIIKSKSSPEDEEVDKDKWLKQIDDHKKLVETIHNMLELSLAPSVPASLRNIPTKYNIIGRLWLFGFQRLLESLRQASLSSSLALEHLQDFIYYAYTFYTGLLEEPPLAAFKSNWLEALGDLARYMMAVAAMVTGGIGSGSALTAANVSEATSADQTDKLSVPLVDDSKSSNGAIAARIDDSPSPSVGPAAARALEVEPEKERWRTIARGWYATGITDQPGTGKLHHHLGLLSRDADGEVLRSVYHFVKSMITLHTFPTSREKILLIWSPTAQARRQLPDAGVTDLFVLLHGMLFTNIQLDDFQSTLSRFMERLHIEGAEEREWIMMAIINIGAVLEYGKPTGILRRAGCFGSRDLGPSGMAMKVMAKKEAARRDEDMDVDEEPTSQGAAQVPETDIDPSDLPIPFKLALQLTFTMLSHVLRRPSRKASPFARSKLNPYLTVLVTFLATVLKHKKTLELLERSVPWEDMVSFFATVPRNIMASQGLSSPVSMPSDGERWSRLTSGCAPPLPEDWCIRGMEWVGRMVFERGYWKSGEDRKAEIEVLDDTEAGEMTDGHIEDDDDEDKNSSGNASQTKKRWIRIIRSAVGLAGIVDGLTWVEGTREWRVDGVLSEKAKIWREEEQRAREEEERRRLGTGWADDSMDIDADTGEENSEESDDQDENDSEDIKELKARRRYLRNLLHSAGQAPPSTRRAPRGPRSEATSRSPLSILPGYTVLIVDTNILLSSLSMFASLVECMHWTVLVPLPVIMELDGLKANTSQQLGEAAENALTYISSHIRSHSMSLKVQTSKGNYLTTLNVRTEDVDFTSGNAERNMDDLILKAAIWHDEHWVDRSAMLKSDGITRNVSNPVKVVLLSLDRNLRLKARSRQLPAASEKDLAALLTTGT